MKCMACEEVIPAEWKACLVSNICPKCGGQIMDDTIKGLLGSLRNAVDELSKVPEETMDMLLSNCGLCRKVNAKNVVMENNPALKIAPNSMQEFLARSKAPHLANRENSKDLKDLVKQIRNREEPEIVEEEDIPMNVIAKGDELVDPNLTPPTLQEIQKIVSSIADAGESDLGGFMDLPPALQQDRLNRLEQRRKITSGVGGGFRRGD